MKIAHSATLKYILRSISSIGKASVLIRYPGTDGSILRRALFHRDKRSCTLRLMLICLSPLIENHLRLAVPHGEI